MNIETNGDFVAEIRGDLKALNKDDYVSARYILSKAYGYVEYIINNRPLSHFLRNNKVFSTCSCIEMIEIDKIKCDIAEFRICDKIMRSKKKLPDMLSNKSGYAIEYVMDIVNSKEFDPLRNVKDFADAKKRQFGGVFKYYYVADGYLWLLNSTAEAVNISAAFLGECSECGKDCDECKSKLEEKFVCPKEFLSSVKENVLQVLLNRTRIIEDTQPDLDANQKSEKQ